MLNNLPDGILLLIYGGLLLLVRQFALQLLDLILRHFVYTIEISERDSPEIYRWFTQWVAHQSFTQNFTKLQVELEESPGTAGIDKRKLQKVAAKVAMRGGGSGPGMQMKGKRNVLFIPGFGTHVFFYKKTLVVCSLAREKEGLLGNTGGTAGPNRVALLWGRAGTAEVVKEMILEARDYAHDQENSEVGVYMPDSRSQMWRRSLSIAKIPFGSVILPEGVAEGIAADCTEFLGSKKW